RHTSFSRDWSSDVCSSDLDALGQAHALFRHEFGRGGNLAPGDAGEVADHTLDLGDSVFLEKSFNLVHTVLLGWAARARQASPNEIEEGRVGKQGRSGCGPA